MNWLRKVLNMIDELHMPPCDAFVAGGRALQQLFPKFLTKDTDVFVLGEETPEQRAWLLDHAKLISHEPDDIASNAEICGSTNWHIDGTTIDLIFTRQYFMVEVLENFDLGICQIAYTLGSNLLIVAPAAVRDITERRITILREFPTENNKSRAFKYSERLGWPVQE